MFFTHLCLNIKHTTLNVILYISPVTAQPRQSEALPFVSSRRLYLYRQRVCFGCL